MFMLACAAPGLGALTIDDFSTPGTSGVGTAWQGFTDRVMGGVSTISAGYLQVDGRTVLRMAGEVSLANNGGFVQVRLPLARRGFFDALAYAGIRLDVRGLPGSYFVHIRTRDSRRPWQYYVAPLPVSEDWTVVEISFADFAAASLRRPFSPEALVSVAIVAAEEEFSADISIRRIELVESTRGTRIDQSAKIAGAGTRP